jgi:hypothetical protein
MKIFGCTASNNIAGETHPLCWDDLRLRGEGVYDWKGNTTKSRLLVIRSRYWNRGVAFLYYEAPDELEPLQEASWTQRKFRLTDEHICFEIKS